VYGLLPLLSGAVWYVGIQVAEQDNKVDGAALAAVFIAAAIPALAAFGLAISRAASLSAKLLAAAGVAVALFLSFWLYLLVLLLFFSDYGD
jgi:sulfite exporter TauE/SafE